MVTEMMDLKIKMTQHMYPRMGAHCRVIKGMEGKNLPLLKELLDMCELLQINLFQGMYPWM